MAGNEYVNRRRAVGTRYGFDVAYLKARTPFPRRYTSHWHGWLPLSSPSGALCLQQVVTLQKLESTNRCFSGIFESHHNSFANSEQVDAVGIRQW